MVSEEPARPESATDSTVDDWFGQGGSTTPSLRTSLQGLTGLDAP